MVSYFQLLNENTTSRILRKYRRIVNRIRLTDKLDPQRGCSSLLCFTKANIPASWTRRENSQWDGTSRLKKILLNTSRCRHVFTCCSFYIHIIFAVLILSVSTSLSRTCWGRHAARLRRFLSSPDPGDAFRSIENSKIFYLKWGDDGSYFHCSSVWLGDPENTWCLTFFVGHNFFCDYRNSWMSLFFVLQIDVLNGRLLEKLECIIVSI